ncbi:SDR family NAD(P)-dependent oxidoreductase [Mycolicibacterium sp.]|uniref:SDR family NAD(P)-dependent oxidoreductase n=1 Tax=Mycolicibacterium sp. TaxID=2320850 RepID=UPI0025D87DEB|nr:SDR family NAD(P)-dependent oxidoreductase [Mycolicibacterium sp.]MCB9409853.1 SDR family oxidoreductase [Mycolicibacterium sp.]
MKFDLAGKSALVTGSSKGIGRTIAEVLHAEGCRVALNGRNANDLARSASRLQGAIGIPGDVTQPLGAQSVVAEAIAAFRGLDVLVCNVGSGRSVQPGNETPEEWQRVFALNLWSATNTIEAARESLVASRGVIVCISSICGIEVIHGAPVTYSAAKAALHAYVRGIARPLGKDGVRINAVAPGNILFDGSVWSGRLAEDKQSVEAMLQRDVSLRSLGSPDDVANLVTYLASPRSKFATGQVWTLDGGQTHR